MEDQAALTSIYEKSGLENQAELHAQHISNFGQLVNFEKDLPAIIDSFLVKAEEETFAPLLERAVNFT